MSAVLDDLELQRDLDDVLYEIVDGVRLEMPPMSAFETVLASLLVSALNQFAQPRRLGIAVTETLFLIDATCDLRRRPDVAFVSTRRWLNSRLTRDNAWDVIPNLAIEIVSPTNLAEDIEKRVFQYLACGVEMVWVVFPETERVHVYRSPESGAIVSRSGRLDGENVVPGFLFKVSELFDALNPPELADDVP